MSLRGYDAWLTREPDCDGETCERCGHPMERNTRFHCWICERCDPPEPDYEREPA